MIDREGQVTSVLLKRRRGEPMVRPPSESLFLQVELGGIVGDVNANPSSPRQVLTINNEVLNRFGLKPGDLRENLVLSGLNVDDLRSGTVLQFGNQAQVRITFGCEVCKKVTPSIRQSITGKRGVLAVVIQSGQIAVGDRVFSLGIKYPVIPASIYQRFLWLIQQIPKGTVVTYSQLATSLGVAHTYCRVFPRYVERAGSRYPLHRIVDSHGRTNLNQRALLEKEGASFIDARVDLGAYMWSAQGIYLR